MADIIDHAYIAGIIDGEGCIAISRHKTGLTIGVAVSMTDPRAIMVIREAFGGKLFLNKKRAPNHKPVWMWRVEARKAEIILRAIQPFLRVKIDQCNLALSLRDHMRSGGILSRGKQHDPTSNKDIEIVAFREAAKRRMHELNKRGIN